MKFSLQLHLKNSISYLDRWIGEFLEWVKIPVPSQRLPNMFTDEEMNWKWDSFIEKSKLQIWNNYLRLVEFLENLIWAWLLDAQGIRLLKEKNIELTDLLEKSPTSQ